MAARWIGEGRVAVDGRVVRDPERPVSPGARIAIDGVPLRDAAPVRIALNKPRGLVTTASDERGRDTVYRCFDGAGLPWIAPVGRLSRCVFSFRLHWTRQEPPATPAAAPGASS